MCKDLGLGDMQGHVGWGRGDIKYRNSGDTGTLMIIAKVRGKCNIARLRELTGGDAIRREMKNEIQLRFSKCGENEK